MALSYSLAWQQIKDTKSSSRWRYYLSFLVFLVVVAIAGSRVAHQDASFSLYTRAPTWHTHRVVTARSQHQAQTDNDGDQKAPQPPQIFNATVDSIAKLADDLVAEEAAAVDGFIKNIKPEDATFENLILPYVQLENEQGPKQTIIHLLQSVGADSKLSEACQNASAVLQEGYMKSSTSPEFFALIDNVYQKQVNDSNLDDEDRQLIGSFWYQFQGQGFGMAEGPNRTRLSDIGKRLDDLGEEFGRAASEDNTTLYFTPQELDGVHQDFLDGLEKGKDENAGKLVLPLDILDNYLKVAQYCKNATIRQSLAVTYFNKAPDNIGRLKEAIALRDEYARLLEYPNFATLQIEGAMANTPKAVDDLLDKIQDRLAAANDEEIAEMKQLKLDQEGKSEVVPVKQTIAWTPPFSHESFLDIRPTMRRTQTSH